MSLREPGDEYGELIPEGSGKVGKALKKSRIYLIVLVIGIIAGLFIQFYFIAPVINSAQANVCKDTILTKELLTTENECLYSLLPNPKLASEQCAQRAFNEQQTTPAPAATDTNTLDINTSPEAQAI